MKPRMKIVAPLVLATLGALAATGYADRRIETEITPAVSPASDAPPAEPVVIEETTTPAVRDEIVAPAPSETVVVPARQYAQPRVTVVAPRPSEDELIRNAVMDRLATDPRLAGRIGVESYRHTVSLTGRVTTTLQVERAATLARSVEGVRDVNNYLQARVGNI